MKLSLFSKPSGPSDEELSESELCERYDRLRRRNFAARSIAIGGIGIASIGVCVGVGMGLPPKEAFLSFCFLGLFSMALGMGMSRDREQEHFKPLSNLSDEERSEALSLIRSVPEARRLSEQAKERGRSLRMFDLEKMREFKKERDAKLLAHESHRLGRNSGVGRLKG